MSADLFLRCLWRDTPDPYTVYSLVHPICQTTLKSIYTTCQLEVHLQCVQPFMGNSSASAVPNIPTKSRTMADDVGGDSASANYPLMETELNESFYQQFVPCGYYAMDGPEFKAHMFIQMYIFPVVLLMGLLWNPLTACALYYIGVHKWSTVFYLSLVSVVDLLILLVRAGDSWYIQVTKKSMSVEIMTASDALCKTYNFLFMFMKHMSPWLIVSVSMELMISTAWPRKTYVVCTMERARNVLMLLVILIFSLDINYFWTWGVPQPGLGCRYTEEFSLEFRDTIWPMLNNTVGLYLPLLFVSVCFFVTVATMISRKSRDEKSIEEELSKYFMELKTLKDFQVICLIICLVFMCLTFFKVVTNILNFMVTRGHIVLDCETQSTYFLTMILVATFENLFTFIFYTMKWIPCVVISQTFRQTLKDGFSSCMRMVTRLVGKVTGKNRRKWGSKSAGSNNGRVTRSGSGRGGEGGGDEEDGVRGQQMKPLVDDSSLNPHNHSYSHRALDPVDDYPLEGNGDIYGTIGGRGGGGAGGGACASGGNSLAVAATVENYSDNHSMDDSRTSFLGKGTDV